MKKSLSKSDIRVRRTHKAILDAFTEMILEMSYHQITVKELAVRAGINRKTFYLHYSTLEDLLEDWQNVISGTYLERTAGMKEQKDLEKLSREFFDYVNESRVHQRLVCDDRFRFIHNNVANKIIAERKTHIHEISDLEEHMQNVIGVCMHFTMCDIYKQWVADGRKIPIEELVKITNILISKGINGLASYFNKED